MINIKSTHPYTWDSAASAVPAWPVSSWRFRASARRPCRGRSDPQSDTPCRSTWRWFWFPSKPGAPYLRRNFDFKHALGRLQISPVYRFLRFCCWWRCILLADGETHSRSRRWRCNCIQAVKYGFRCVSMLLTSAKQKCRSIYFWITLWIRKRTFHNSYGWEIRKYEWKTSEKGKFPKKVFISIRDES